MPTSPSVVLITPFDASSIYPPCLTSNFYGNYHAGQSSVFISTPECVEAWSATTLVPSASIVPYDAKEQEQQLVWIEEMAVEESLKTLSFGEELDILLERLVSPNATPESQAVLAPVNDELFVIHRTAASALLSLSAESAQRVTTVLPPYLRSTLLPSSPQSSIIPVPAPDVSRVKHLLKTLKFDPEVAQIVNNISLAQMNNDIRFLTGEDSQSGIVSRHSFSSGARFAAKWLQSRFEETGATCELRSFSIGYAPNVICRYPAPENVTSKVILSAHYDSRGSFGSTRAPGGDDDGSGVTSLLSLARTIARKGIHFQHAAVELVAFAGEEQGLVGSRAYSRELRQLDANITIMIQADMLAYHAAGEPPQLGLPATIGTPEVAQLVSDVAAIYSPELKVGFTTACCSDHQSFHEQGFAATQVFERAGPIADPMYHNSGDLSDRAGYDLEQVRSIAKVQFATLLHAAGYKLHN